MGSRDVLASTSRLPSRSVTWMFHPLLHPRSSSIALPFLFVVLRCSCSCCSNTSEMARGIEGNEIATPRATLKKSSSSQSSKAGPKQQSIAGFFQRRPESTSSTVTPAKRPSDATASADAPKSSKAISGLTPAPSSVAASSSPQTAPGDSQQSSVVDTRDKENGNTAHSCLDRKHD